MFGWKHNHRPRQEKQMGNPSRVRSAGPTRLRQSRRVTMAPSSRGKNLPLVAPSRSATSCDAWARAPRAAGSGRSILGAAPPRARSRLRTLQPTEPFARLYSQGRSTHRPRMPGWSRASQGDLKSRGDSGPQRAPEQARRRCVKRHLRCSNADEREGTRPACGLIQPLD
jgi:hypothetical protein